jgi:hypothetical protein
MVNYGKGKVYKIWSPNGDKIYIGSTTKEYLSQRIHHHRYCYRLKKGYTTACILFEEYGVENCKIELLEAKECTSRDELAQLEGKYIRDLECVNKQIPNRTMQEWREDNKEEIKEYKKEYNNTHREERKIYIDKNKEKINEQQRLRYEKKKLEQKS